MELLTLIGCKIRKLDFMFSLFSYLFPDSVMVICFIDFSFGSSGATVDKYSFSDVMISRLSKQ
jgi:hypothetical protein